MDVKKEEQFMSSSDSGRRFRRRKARIRGFAPDGSEIFITRGEGFELRGGSEPTHKKMLEVAGKIMSQLKVRGYDLDNLSTGEFREVTRLIERLKVEFGSDKQE